MAAAEDAVSQAGSTCDAARRALRAVVLQAFDIARDYVEPRHKSMPMRCFGCYTSYTVADTVTQISTFENFGYPWLPRLF